MPLKFNWMASPCGLHLIENRLENDQIECCFFTKLFWMHFIFGCSLSFVTRLRSVIARAFIMKLLIRTSIMIIVSLKMCLLSHQLERMRLAAAGNLPFSRRNNSKAILLRVVVRRTQIGYCIRAIQVIQEILAEASNLIWQWFLTKAQSHWANKALNANYNSLTWQLSDSDGMTKYAGHCASGIFPVGFLETRYQPATTKYRNRSIWNQLMQTNRYCGGRAPFIISIDMLHAWHVWYMARVWCNRLMFDDEKKNSTTIENAIKRKKWQNSIWWSKP